MQQTATVLLLVGVPGVISAAIPQLGSRGSFVVCGIATALGLLLLNSNYHVIGNIFHQLAR